MHDVASERDAAGVQSSAPADYPLRYLPPYLWRSTPSGAEWTSPNEVNRSLRRNREWRHQVKLEIDVLSYRDEVAEAYERETGCRLEFDSAPPVSWDGYDEYCELDDEYRWREETRFAFEDAILAAIRAFAELLSLNRAQRRRAGHCNVERFEIDATFAFPYDLARPAASPIAAHAPPARVCPRRSRGEELLVA